jgi:hypothetical protein
MDLSDTALNVDSAPALANMSSTRLTMATASSLLPYSPAEAIDVWTKNAIAANTRTMAGLHEGMAARGTI